MIDVLRVAVGDIIYEMKPDMFHDYNPYIQVHTITKIVGFHHSDVFYHDETYDRNDENSCYLHVETYNAIQNTTKEQKLSFTETSANWLYHDQEQFLEALTHAKEKRTENIKQSIQNLDDSVNNIENHINKNLKVLS